MNDKLRELENSLKGQSRRSNLSQKEILRYPESIRQIHSYHLFGNSLLSIPANLIIERDDDNFERPFRFTDDIEELIIFESEFRQEIPEKFIQIGSLFGSQIVLLNILNDEVHIFHVADIVDKDWIKYKLEHKICDLSTLIENIRVQTVCCLINPKDNSKYEILEIRDGNTLFTEEFEKKFENTTEIWKEYLTIIRKAIDKGYVIHYAPQKVIDELNIKTANS